MRIKRTTLGSSSSASIAFLFSLFLALEEQREMDGERRWRFILRIDVKSHMPGLLESRCTRCLLWAYKKELVYRRPNTDWVKSHLRYFACDGAGCSVYAIFFQIYFGFNLNLAKHMVDSDWLWPCGGTYSLDSLSLFFPFPPLTCQSVLMPVQCPWTQAMVSEGTCKTVMLGKEDDWRSWRAITALGKGHVLWDLLLTPANRGDYGGGYKFGDLLSYHCCLMFPLNLTFPQY